MKYNWQKPDWPQFKFSLLEIEDILVTFAEETGHATGLLKGMPRDTELETIVNLMVSEAIKSSEIEGEYLGRQDVASSIRNNLGLNNNPEKIKDKKAQGIGQLMVAVRNTFSQPLSEEILFEWHTMLFGQSADLAVGKWRFHDEPMQIISGAVGKEKIHFEAPPGVLVPAEMQNFIQWFNDTAPGGKIEMKKAPVRSAIAHLYFESIHSFEDGNGRIGRAIAEKALAQTIGRPVLLSLSQTIEADKKSYYSALENAQHDNEITTWIKYFVTTVLAAQVDAKNSINFTLGKTRFFDKYKKALNQRQVKAINKIFEAGPGGFVGGMTANKYMSITKTSKATATRDLQILADLQVLLPKGGGRSTHYISNDEIFS